MAREAEEKERKEMEVLKEWTVFSRCFVRFISLHNTVRVHVYRNLRRYTMLRILGVTGLGMLGYFEMKL